MPPALTGRVRGLAFISGMCALVYQIMWMRHFRLIFGASTGASAAVIAIFMGGLGAGAMWVGRRADSVQSPLRTYGNLELGVAASAATTPVLVEVARWVYVALGGSQSLGGAGSLAVQLCLAVLVLGGPCVLMGATLPTLARVVSTGDDRGRSELGYIYAINTLGAVTGSFLGTFFLLEILGVRTSILLFAGLNAIIGLLAWQLARAPEGARSDGDGAPPAAVPRDLEAADASAPIPFVYAASGLVGFAFFVMEIVWYRMFAPLLGGSAYSFGLILTMALLGIGSGAAFYGVYGRLRRPILATFSITCAVEALLIAVPFGVGDDLAALTLVSRGLEVFGFAGLVMSWVVITAFVVFPPAFVAGFQFPLLVGLLGEGREAIARQVGAAYFANTVGSILGALGSGFGLLVLVGALRLWSAMVIVLLAVAALALALAWRRAPRERWSGGVVAVSVAVSGICLYAEGPTSAWRHAPIGAGRVEDAAIQSANNFEAFRRRFQTNVTWEADGRESSVGLRSLHGVSFSVSGKTDGHTVGDFDTVVMCPLIAAAFHPEPRRGLVIGLGTGTSAGWLAEVPTMQQVDVVEFEPAILEVARVAAPVNHDVLDHPKVQVIIGDGREVLMTSTTTYDVIMSEPSNPYRAGIASLYSQDFYEAASLTMSEDGIFVQWLQGYEIDARTFESAVATLRSVFPAVEVWMTDYAGDIALVAFKSEAPLDTAIMEARLSEPPYREALAKSWGVAGVPGLLSGFTIGRDATTTILEQNRDFIDTDDLPVMEFGFTRNVGVTRRRLDRDALVSLGRELGGGSPALRPSVAPLAVREAVDARRTGALEESGFKDLDPATPLRMRAESRASFYKRRYGDALQQWMGQIQRQPVHAADAERLAWAAAEVGVDEFTEVVDVLAGDFPAVVAISRAIRASHTDDVDGAVAAVEVALTRMQTDVFFSEAIARRMFDRMRRMARGRPEVGARLHEALAKPFLLYRLEEDRRLLRVNLTRALSDPRDCVDALADLEPHFPWDRNLLRVRADCYERAGDPRTAHAQGELDAFERG